MKRAEKKAASVLCTAWHRRTAAGITAALVAAAMTLAAAGCGGNGTEAAGGGNTQQSADATVENTQQSADAAGDGTQQSGETAGVTPLTDYVSEEEYALADQWKSCNDEALAAVMRKAEAGEPVTIACIGGSITQGTISAGESDSKVGFTKCYADLFFAWWTEAFPETDFTFVNAGIGGTDSYLGVHRVQEEVLDYEPDLVLVEFSVNDGDSPTYKRTYDNLVRRILLSEGSPAVMLLFMGQTNGATAQASHVLVGYNYALPMVSYYNVMEDMMEQGIYTAGELSGDEVHPSALGHAITGEILWKYLNNVYAERETLAEPEPFDADPVTNEKYLNGAILDAADVVPQELGTFAEASVCTQFPDGWTCENGEGGLTITAEFQNLGILYYATIDGKSGQFDIYVDGERVGTIDADFSGGWGNAIEAQEVYTSDGVAEHTVVIKKAADSTGDVFSLLGLLTS